MVVTLTPALMLSFMLGTSGALVQRFGEHTSRPTSLPLVIPRTISYTTREKTVYKRSHRQGWRSHAEKVRRWEVNNKEIDLELADLRDRFQGDVITFAQAMTSHMKIN
ncbi:hypothetical protein VNO78_33600 [Psophocarpus tetragonolobus]|uniref:Uncharacterized protein n=1 Tax=Psophocarpus tetragonolobus TaxID=3891 RepID=A0AAN9NXQ2_PSOTE